MYDIIIIGAGPAGLMAAGSAALEGKSVAVIEKNRLTGKKLRITGKGRCNVTNVAENEEVMKNVCGSGKFLYSALGNFSGSDTVSFFESLGVPLKTERGGRVFPQSDKAADIANALEDYVKNCGVEIICEKAVSVLTKNGAVSGVKLSDGRVLEASSVIIATGGKSYPRTGSTGDGYKFAENTGHTIITPRGALVPVETHEKWVSHLQGLSLKNVTLSLFCEDKKIFEDMGEMLFTHFGVSGPLVLSASCHITDDSKNYKIIIDLKPALDEKTLDKRILRDFEESKNKDFANSLGGLLPSKLIPVFVELSGVEPHTKVNSVTREQRLGMVNLLKNLTLTVKGLRPIDEAIVTAGGVDIAEVNPSTMESKKVKGLFFAGEVLNLQAYTGGFNLQIAFSTGYLAGKKA